jgi:bifunctional DNase/RNase
MRPMRVLRLVVHARTRQPVLLLGEVDGERCLPVFLRSPQAEVIAAGQRSEGDPPLTQDVLLPVVEALGHTLDAVEVTELRDGVFSADLVFDGSARVGVRPSDALAVAVREGLTIRVAEAILDEVGQPIAELFPDGGDAPPDEQLRDFRQFIDEVSPEDFADPPPSPS